MDSDSNDEESGEGDNDKQTKKKKGLFGGFRRKKNSQSEDADHDDSQDPGEMSGFNLAFGSDGKGPSVLVPPTVGRNVDQSFQDLIGGVENCDLNPPSDDEQVDGDKHKKKGIWRRKAPKKTNSSSSDPMDVPDEDEDLSESGSEDEGDTNKRLGFGRYFGGRKKKENQSEDTAESDNESVSSKSSRRSIFGRKKVKDATKHQLLGEDDDEFSGPDAY